jgi:hypothetical protein
MPALFLREDTSDGGETPVLIRFFKFGSRNADRGKTRAKLDQLMLITNGEVNVGRVMISRTAELVGVLDGSMRCLNSLLREWNVATRDGVEIVLRKGLGRHNDLTGN